MWRSSLLAFMSLAGCICPFDASRCIHRRDPERFVREYGRCQPPSQADLSVQPAASAASGSLSRSDVLEGVCKANWKVKWCYESAVAAFYPPPHTVPEGHINVIFTIGPDGRVDEVVIRRDELRSPSLACCVVQTVRELRFPKPLGGGAVVVNHPFMFLEDTPQNQRLYPAAGRDPCAQ